MSSNKKRSNDPFGEGSWSSGPRETYSRCHHKHPELKLGTGVLVGASGYEPRTGFDVYVHLGASRIGTDTLPWETSKAVRISYGITDMGVPHEPDRFKKLVTFLCTQLQAGKRVHVGCFGGHGRTGMVLAAVYKELSGDKDAVQWVRANHCHKAVESQTQISFLTTHYGTSHAKPTKSLSKLRFDNDPFSGGSPTPPSTIPLAEFMSRHRAEKPKAEPKALAKAGVHVPDTASKKSVWS